MAKRVQRRWRVGHQYKVEGSGVRRLKLVGLGKINGRETLMFHPVRKARKLRKARKRR